MITAIRPYLLTAVLSFAVMSSACTLSVGGSRSIYTIGLNSTHTLATPRATVEKRTLPGLDLQINTGRWAFLLGWTSEIYVQAFPEHLEYEPGHDSLHLGFWALPLGIWSPYRDEQGRIVGEKTIGWTMRSIPRFRWEEGATSRPTFMRVWRLGLGIANYPIGAVIAFPYHLRKKIIGADSSKYEIDFQGDSDYTPEGFKLVVKPLQDTSLDDLSDNNADNLDLVPPTSTDAGLN